MKKMYIFALSILFTAGLFAQNRSVTFRVDMTGQTVSTSGVHVAGSFQSTPWTPGATTMTQVGTTGIYAVTVQIPDGQYQFKFLNGNAWGTDESVPAESGIEPANGNYNRWVNITKDTTLAAVPFAGNNPAGLQLLRFKVDMAMQTVSTNGVHVAGNFQNPNWQAAATRMYNVASQRPSLYERIVYVAAGTYQYKFINNNDWPGVESVPSACQVGGGNDNRQIVVAGATIAPEVCFSMCTPCPTAPVPSYNVTFNVDMRNHLKCNPMLYLDVAGTLNGWQGGDTLTDANNDSIFSITLPIDSGEIQFKFRANTATATGWEGVPNRVITVSAAGSYNFCFNEAGVGAYCTPIPSASDITFRVDFSQAGVTPASQIYLIGDFTQWQTNAIQMTPVLSSPGLYETTVTNFCPGSLFYKFVNGDLTVTANEENTGLDSCGVPNGVGGFNRTYVRTSSQPVALQYVFNTCDLLTIGVEENTMNRISMNPNPMRTHTVIELGEGNYTVLVMDLAGRTVRELKHATGTTILERGNLISGMYILSVINNKGEARTSKFVVE